MKEQTSVIHFLMRLSALAAIISIVGCIVNALMGELGYLFPAVMFFIVLGINVIIITFLNKDGNDDVLIELDEKNITHVDSPTAQE